MILFCHFFLRSTSIRHSRSSLSFPRWLRLIFRCLGLTLTICSTIGVVVLLVIESMATLLTSLCFSFVYVELPWHQTHFQHLTRPKHDLALAANFSSATTAPSFFLHHTAILLTAVVFLFPAVPTSSHLAICTYVNMARRSKPQICEHCGTIIHKRRDVEDHMRTYHSEQDEDTVSEPVKGMRYINDPLDWQNKQLTPSRDQTRTRRRHWEYARW